MAETTKIEWCDATFNPWIGCTKVSPACDNCYAAVSTPTRALGVEWGHGKERRRTSPANWALPLRWNAKAAKEGVRPRVFCASLADVFDHEVPYEWRSDLWALIRATPSLDWLLLTKRPVAMLRWAQMEGWEPNAWAGTTVENQAMADLRIPQLLKVPAPVRFLSVEPLLGPVELRGSLLCPRCENDGSVEVPGGGKACPKCFDFRQGSPGPDNAINWVICGGESGNNARPMHPDWARSLRDQCKAAGVPFLFKQWGEWGPGENRIANGTQHRKDMAYQFAAFVPDNTVLHNPFPIGTITDETQIVVKHGKKRNGRLLDGVEHNEFPTVAR